MAIETWRFTDIGSKPVTIHSDDGNLVNIVQPGQTADVPVMVETNDTGTQWSLKDVSFGLPELKRGVSINFRTGR